MAGRNHLSIGEVLSLLRDEFPDVTISKIRFLESQGLVDPERTPSGYRKFYEHDVERLRWILRQQREHFLPLKVIRGRLTDQGEDIAEPTLDLSAPGGDQDDESAVGTDRPGGWTVGSAVPAGHGSSDGPIPAPGAPSSSAAAADPRAPLPPPSRGRDQLESSNREAYSSTTDKNASQRPAPTPSGPTPAPAPTPSGPTPAPTPTGPTSGPTPGPTLGAGRRAGPETAGKSAAPALAPADPSPADPSPAGPGPASPPDAGSAAGSSRRAQPAPAGEAPVSGRPRPGASPVPLDKYPRDSLTLEELAQDGGASLDLLREMQQYGLLVPQTTVAGVPYFDDDARVLARLAASFARYGIEARHLRSWRNSAEREASLFSQIVLPLLRQRNPQARSQAAGTLAELTELGSELRQVLVRQALREVR